MFPRSLPYYQWPAHLMAARHAPMRWLGALLFHLAYGLGRVVRWATVPEKRIAVIRTDGLGDAILFEPALRSLAARHPDQRLHLWAPRPVCEMFSGAPYLSRLIVIPRGGKAGNLAYFNSPLWRWRMGYRLGRFAYDIAVYPAISPEPMGNWIVASLRAADRWVVNGDTENQFDWQRQRAIASADRVLEPAGGSVHELTNNAHLALHWDAQIAGDWPVVHLLDRSSREGLGIVRRWRGDAMRLHARSLIGIIPAGTAAVNSYPPGAWARVLTELWTAHRLLPAFIGSPAEQDTIDGIVGPLRAVPHLRLDAPIGVPALAEVIAGLDAVITIDTGPAHLAVARRVPAVILSAGGHPGRFFPWPGAESAIVLSHPMPCAGCLNRCTLHEPECLTRIGPDQVIDACLDLTVRRPQLRAAGSHRAGGPGREHERLRLDEARPAQRPGKLMSADRQGR